MLAYYGKSVLLYYIKIVIIILKTMEQASMPSKLQTSNKSKKKVSQTQHKSTGQQLNFQFTEKQVEDIRKKLPVGYFLINTQGGQLQAVQNQCKAILHQKKQSISQMPGPKLKKIAKKQKDPEDIKNLTSSSKASQKDNPSAPTNGKEKKQRKTLKKTEKVEKQKQKQKVIQVEQMQNQGNKLIQQACNYEIKQQGGLIKAQKQSQQVKNSSNNRQIQPVINQMLEIQYKEALQNQANQINYMEKQQKFQNFYDCNFANYTIPYLQSGLPRYTPESAQAKITKNIESENLCQIFGLPSASNLELPKLNQTQKIFCMNVLQKLKAHRFSQAFRRPVSPERQGVPDYHYVVYQPIDLQTIARKVVKDKYRSIFQFHADINMIFLNSYKYNLRWSKYFIETIEFQDYYHELLKQIAQNPQQYAKQQVIKAKGTKIDSEQGQYVAETFSKKGIYKKKGQGLTKSQYMQKQQKHQFQKNKNMYDDHSGINSYSMAIQSINDFNMEAQFHKNETKLQQQQQQQPPGKKPKKYKRIHSMQLDPQQYFQSNTIQPQAKKQETAKQSTNLKQPQQSNHPEVDIFALSLAEQALLNKNPVNNSIHLNLRSKQPTKSINNQKKNMTDDYNDDSYNQIKEQQNLDQKALMQAERLGAIHVNSNQQYLRMMQIQSQRYHQHLNVANRYPGEQAQIWKNFNNQAYGMHYENQMQMEKYQKQQIQQILKEEKMDESKAKEIQQKRSQQYPYEIYPQNGPMWYQHHQQFLPMKQPQSITVMNLNTHPQPYPFSGNMHISQYPQLYPPNMPPNSTALHPNIDTYIQNVQHPNSGVTAALTNTSTPVQFQKQKSVKQTKPKAIPKAPKSKIKNKNKDQQYRCSSQDQEYMIENQRNYFKRHRIFKGRAKASKQISNSNAAPNMSQSVSHQPAKRGRHPKKLKLLQKQNSIPVQQQPGLDIPQQPPKQKIPPQAQSNSNKKQQKIIVNNQIQIQNSNNNSSNNNSKNVPNQIVSISPENIFIDQQPNSLDVDGFLQIQFSQNQSIDINNRLQ